MKATTSALLLSAAFAAAASGAEPASTEFADSLFEGQGVKFCE